MGGAVKDATGIRKEFVGAGFEVIDGGNRFEVRKNHCTRAIERQADGTWLPVGQPLFGIGGSTFELEDRGYQKFWYNRDHHKRFPVHSNDFKTLHHFDQEVRYILGLKSLYHESLGTTNARTVYDRLTGRPDR
jgi:hypothetical protein